MFLLFAFVPIDVGVLLFEYLALPHRHLVENDLQSLRIDDPTLIDITLCSTSAKGDSAEEKYAHTERGKYFLIHIKQLLQAV